MNLSRRGRQPVPRLTATLLATLLAGPMVGLLAGCSDDAADQPGKGTPTAGLRGAETGPRPDGTAGTSPTVTPSPSLNLGFDCTAVRAAQDRLDASIAEALERYDVSANSPEGFDVTMVVTAVQAPDFWAAALATRPPEMRTQADRVIRHWRDLRDQLATSALGISVPAGDPTADSAADSAAGGTGPAAGVTTTTGSAPTTTLAPARLHAVRLAVESLARQGAGTAVAEDEQALRQRLARACPPS